MDTETLRSAIKEMAGNTIFGATFVNKNGEVRDMVCRLGVKTHLKGGDLPFDPVDKGLLPVFDMQKEGYRMINLKTITELRVKGVTYTFGDE